MHSPLYSTLRKGCSQTLRLGSFAVVDAAGRLILARGHPNHVCFIRSAAKPFQLLPFVEEKFHLKLKYSKQQLAISASSHYGSQRHVNIVKALLDRLQLSQQQLQCGVHYPQDKEEFKKYVQGTLKPDQIYNNCSGKHSTFLAFAKAKGLPLEDYLEQGCPLQKRILSIISQMCKMDLDKIVIEKDGCSAPNFSLPLFNTALGMAKFMNFQEYTQRSQAAFTIFQAMSDHPDLISNPGEFDAQLMKAFPKQILCKRGADGFLLIGVRASKQFNSRSLGIAIKVEDGDGVVLNDNIEWNSVVRPAVALKILQKMGIYREQKQGLSKFREKQIRNLKGHLVGQSRCYIQ